MLTAGSDDGEVVAKSMAVGSVLGSAGGMYLGSKVDVKLPKVFGSEEVAFGAGPYQFEDGSNGFQVQLSGLLGAK